MKMKYSLSRTLATVIISFSSLVGLCHKISAASSENSPSVPVNTTQEIMLHERFPVIFVSTPQMAGLVNSLWPGADVRLLMTASDDPHTFDPSPKNLQDYQEADIVILDYDLSYLNSLALKSTARRYLINEDKWFLKVCSEHEIDTRNEHLSYNIFAYEAVLRILKEEEMSPVSRIENEIHIAAEEKKIADFITSLNFNALEMAKLERPVLCVSSEGIADSMHEHLIFEINKQRAILGKDSLWPPLLKLSPSSSGCTHHQEMSGKDFMKKINQIEDFVINKGNVMITGDVESNKKLNEFLKSHISQLTYNLITVDLEHNLDPEHKGGSYEKFIGQLLSDLCELGEMK
jgi:hypothetical protein